MLVISIAIGADHGGYALKEKIKNTNNQKIKWIDVGAFGEGSSNYAEFAHLVAQKVQNREVDFGILICRSGIGVTITANRYRGVYAALCLNEAMALSARTHNNANILCIAADYTTFDQACAMMELFLSASFETGGRHEFRVSSIDGFDVELCDD